MPANMRKLMQGVPRPLQIAARDAKDEPVPMGHEAVSSKEQMARLEPLMGLIARGDVPLDQTSAKAIQTYLDGMDKRVR